MDQIVEQSTFYIWNKQAAHNIDEEARGSDDHMASQ
jgi:hypothetical protein